MTKNLMKMAMAILGTVGGFAIMSNVANAATKHPSPELSIRVGKSTISATGGAVTVRATERGMTNCQWISTPRIKGFDKKVKCAAKMSRIVHIPSTTTSKTYTLTMRVKFNPHTIAKSATLQELGPVATTTITAPAPVSLAVHLDPTFVQSASNPLSVVYIASAAASETNNLSQVQQLASLPNGVLDFYSDGNLACSTNVGGTMTTNNCPVTYTALGQHSVVTEYISGTNSATETDVEQINGQTTTTSVSLTGDPAQGATTSTLTATVASSLGTDTMPAAGAVTFNVDNAILHTSQAGQTMCTLDWTGPTFSQNADAYLASATSPDCVVTGTLLQNVQRFSYGAAFMGSLGLSPSSSTITTSDWPVAPLPITTYVEGDPYIIAISPTSISGCTVSGLMEIQFCLNAPTLELTDASTTQVVSQSFDYQFLSVSLADNNGVAFLPGTGIPCGIFESDTDQCALGDDNQFGLVPNPLVVTLTTSPPTGATVQDAPITVWQGDQKITTVTVHALLGSKSIQSLSS